jgi:hypothetical protein
MRLNNVNSAPGGKCIGSTALELEGMVMAIPIQPDLIRVLRSVLIFYLDRCFAGTSLLEEDCA